MIVNHCSVVQRHDIYCKYPPPVFILFLIADFANVSEIIVGLFDRLQLFSSNTTRLRSNLESILTFH